jgi:UDP-N-acetyl-D-glucosamine/UDP-N-acetyl-D-galactosamine dehydrogenase
MKRNISVIGLGYVGLPVAVAFGKLGQTIGFDINSTRINELCHGLDSTNEVTQDELSSADILFTTDVENLKKANFHIIAIPTPINDAKQPDLRPMEKASESVGKALSKGDIVVYESTVYPGATEEVCLPILEKISGLKAGIDFKIGYSPERINPADKEHVFTKIMKIVSGQDQETLDEVADVYESVVTAGVHRASSIKVAEAAKVIENSQRDLNIAFINELAMIFNLMDIDTNEVLTAAQTKWNFLPFKPGLVGGHCIGVDPYYLTYKAEKLGYNPQVILSGRRINDNMGKFIARETIKEMIKAGHQVLGSTVTILGLTFKENCPDLRNSKVIDIINELKEFGVNVQVHDPYADPKEADFLYGITLSPYSSLKPADAVILPVAHDFYQKLTGKKLKKLLNPGGIIIDVKNIIPSEITHSEGLNVWKL